MLSSIVLVVSLAAILTLLAVLQYRWSGEVSQAERQRMQSGLLASMSQFRMQFNNELQELGFALQRDESDLQNRDWQRYAGNINQWLSGSNGRLVSGIYLWVDEMQLLRLNRSSNAFEPAAWPPGFKTVKDRYDRIFSDPARLGRDIRTFSWTVLFRIPLLIHPLVTFQPSPGRPMGQFVGYLMVELNLDTIRQELLPELAQKYFGGPDGFVYQIAITSGRNPALILYRSDPGLAATALASADARTSLIGDPRGNFGRRSPNGAGETGAASEENSRPPTFPLNPRAAPKRSWRGAGPPQQRQMRRGTNAPPGQNWRRPGPQLMGRGPEPPAQGRARGFGPLSPGDDGDWELVVKHREGSLEAAVEGLRRRNLAIGFGTLLLLATSMALIVASARRVQWLAHLQMDFVTRVTHELKTPLAVICSAGDNLADGIAHAGRQVRQYGELIRNEGWKLTGMVEQILRFAKVQSGRSHYNLQPAGIEEVAEAALKLAEPMIAAAGFSVDKSFAADLPPVNVDTAALSQGIQNLIQNALKYSGESRWLGVRIGTAMGKHGTEVQLVVEDRGIGIEASDLPHIFDPFYRGRTATAAQIHGTGLGLFMVREAVVAMGGRIIAKSHPGKGSAFTISLPALEAEKAHPSVSEDSHLSNSHGKQDIADRG